jgi:hypothetical protein
MVVMNEGSLAAGMALTCPLNSAGRFSLKAFMPSRASSVPNTGQPTSSERSIASASARHSSCSRSDFITAFTATGPFLPIWAAIASASSSVLPFGTMRLISPQSSASCAVTWRPVSRISAARQ